jgi:hypothetical protein
VVQRIARPCRGPSEEDRNRAEREQDDELLHGFVLLTSSR